MAWAVTVEPLLVPIPVPAAPTTWKMMVQVSPGVVVVDRNDWLITTLATLLHCLLTVPPPPIAT
jgi:hypothetical protein